MNDLCRFILGLITITIVILPSAVFFYEGGWMRRYPAQYHSTGRREASYTGNQVPAPPSSHQDQPAPTPTPTSPPPPPVPAPEPTLDPSMSAHDPNTPSHSHNPDEVPPHAFEEGTGTQDIEYWPAGEADTHDEIDIASRIPKLHQEHEYGHHEFHRDDSFPNAALEQLTHLEEPAVVSIDSNAETSYNDKSEQLEHTESTQELSAADLVDSSNAEVVETVADTTPETAVEIVGERTESDEGTDVIRDHESGNQDAQVPSVDSAEPNDEYLIKMDDDHLVDLSHDVSIFGHEGDVSIEVVENDNLHLDQEEDHQQQRDRERVEREEAERQAQEQHEREERERLEREEVAREEEARLEREAQEEREKEEAERLERLEREEQLRIESERIEREVREEREREERERIEHVERIEREERERAEKEERERLEREEERLVREAQEREEQERIAREKQEQQEQEERVEREEAQRIEDARLEAERLEQERIRREIEEHDGYDIQGEQQVQDLPHVQDISASEHQDNIKDVLQDSTDPELIEDPTDPVSELIGDTTATEAVKSTTTAVDDAFVQDLNEEEPPTPIKDSPTDLPADQEQISPQTIEPTPVDQVPDNVAEDSEYLSSANNDNQVPEQPVDPPLAEEAHKNGQEEEKVTLSETNEGLKTELAATESNEETPPPPPASLPPQALLSIGVETSEGLMQVMIPRGSSKFTVSSRFWPQNISQKTVVVQLLEGERPIAKFNTPLCGAIEFQLDSSPRMLPYNFEISLRADHVEVTLAQASGARETINVAVNPGRLTRDVVERAIRESTENAESDDASLEAYIFKRAQYGGQATLPNEISSSSSQTNPPTPPPPPPPSPQTQQQQEPALTNQVEPVDTKGTWIGIDFGGTRSAACIVQDNQITFINEPRVGAPHFPSYVWYGSSGETLSGLVARNRSVVDPINTVSQMSRFVGRKFSSDTEIRSEALRLGYTLEAVADRPHAMTTGGPVDLVQAAAEFLRYVKSVASASSGKPVNNAVISITYPQSNNLRMSEIETAGRLAGFENVEVVSDAHLIVHSLISLEGPPQTVLVINIGGKTSEASALRVANGQISRITGQHKADFGFEEFERRMMEHVLRTFADTYGMDASESSEAVQQVHTFFETNFMDIFAQGTLEVSFNDFYGSKPLEQKLFVEELELLNNDYLRIIEQMASDVASESGQKFGYYVDRVVIAGAVAHMKPLVDKLHAQFPTKFMDDAQLHVPSEKRIAHVRTPCICPLLWFVPDS